MTTLRNRIGHWLRKYADRIDDHGAPRCMSSHTFTFETGVSTGSGSGTDWRPDMAVYVAGPMGPAMRDHLARQQAQGRWR